MFHFGPVASLDEVPNEFKSVYNTAAGTDGKFTVADAHKGIVTSYQGTLTTLNTERAKITSLNNENATRRQALAPWEALAADLGVTPEDAANPDLPGAVKKHVNDLTDKVKGGDAFKGNLKTIKEEAERQVNALKTAHATELGAMQSTLETYLIDKEVGEHLVAAKAKNGGKVLLPTVKQKLKVVKTEDGKYVVRALDDAGAIAYNSAQQPMGVKDVVDSIKSNAEYAFAFDSEAAGGTGAQRTGATPIVAKTANVGGEKSSVSKISEGLTQMQQKR